MVLEQNLVGDTAQLYEFCEAPLDEEPKIGLSLWLRSLSSRRILIAADDVQIARDYLRAAFPDFEIDTVNTLGTTLVVRRCS